MFNIIDQAIAAYLQKNGSKQNFAIYPFGRNGIIVKEILNKRYGVQEKLIVDNYLSKVNPLIKNLNEVKDYGDYVWILTCNNPGVYDEIYTSITPLVPEEQIISIFELRDTPCFEFLELVQKKKNEYRNIAVAEIGVGIGVTALAVCTLLDEGDTYYCFDFDETVEDLLCSLRKTQEIKCKLAGYGNTHKTFDSYNWKLSELLFQMRNDNLRGVFDVVYLDGAHNFYHDGLACCLLKELVKPGGYIVFDDMDWSYENSSMVNSNSSLWIKEGFTNEQIKDCQVSRAVSAFMINDIRFQEIFIGNSVNSHRTVFRRILSWENESWRDRLPR